SILVGILCVFRFASLTVRHRLVTALADIVLRRPVFLLVLGSWFLVLLLYWFLVLFLSLIFSVAALLTLAPIPFRFGLGHQFGLRTRIDLAHPVLYRIQDAWKLLGEFPLGLRQSLSQLPRFRDPLRSLFLEQH